MVRHFLKNGDFITCPLISTAKAVCQGVMRIALCQGVQTGHTDIYASDDIGPIVCILIIVAVSLDRLGVRVVPFDAPIWISHRSKKADIFVSSRRRSLLLCNTRYVLLSFVGLSCSLFFSSVTRPIWAGCGVMASS